ncbi:MAG: hypothetical protein J6K61_05430 [Clostridia bacterium]|nr:hypothetical protein [Clostridia bacterium]
MKVLIFSVSTGQGHNIAARAVETCLIEKGATCVVDDAAFRVSKLIGFATNKIYALAISACRFFYGKFYAVAERRKSNSYTPSLTRSINRAIVKNIRLKIEKEDPDIILCTHPFAAVAVDTVKQKHPFRAKIAGIVTDFTMHPFWEDALRLDMLFVAHEDLRAEAAAKGFPAEKVICLGIPIQKHHETSLSKKEAKQELDLDESLPLVLVASGSMGHGNLLKTLKEIDAAPLPIHIVAVCGTNKKAKRKIQRATFQNKITAFGYTDKIPLLMTAAECLISKPGGLSTSEALAKSLPLLIYDPIPGHEVRNAAFLEKHGAALWVKAQKDLLPALLSVLENDEKKEGMRQAARALQKPTAASDIADALFSLLGNEEA